MERKLTKSEKSLITNQLFELSVLNTKLISEDVKVNPYTALLISDYLKKAIDNYKDLLQPN